MTEPAIDIAGYRYDTTRALFDGSVAVDGVDATMHTGATLPEIFERMMRRREFTVAELGLTFYLRMLDTGDCPFIALPVFPNRVFRHSCVFVNVHSGIERPEDLVGRRIGEFGTYGQDSGVWAKGILSDDHGFAPERNEWVIGGLDHPMAPFDFIPHPHPSGVRVTPAPDGTTLNQVIESGEIDALFTANVPRCVLDGSPNVRRLFVDHETVERDYHRRTGIFPIMHAVVVERDFLDAHPEAVRSVYRAFVEAKDARMQQYRHDRLLYEVTTMVPWMNALIERNLSCFDDDWWPYGIADNRHAIDTYLRYHHEQGLSSRRWTIEEIFAPAFSGT